MTRTILCNTNAQVMETISWEEAITKILLGKAVSIKDSEIPIRSQSLEMFRPEIIMLTNYSNDANRYREWENREQIPKRLVHIRDNWECAYCGEFGDTIDHIIPKDLGGNNKWDNVITACKKCNNLKDNRLLTEIGWSLRYDPTPVTWRTKLSSEQMIVDNAMTELLTPSPSTV